MRIPRSWVLPMARRIVEDLLRKRYISSKVDKEELVSITHDILLDELMVEDRLNEEVREILKQFEEEIENRRLDYKRLFDLTKQKLVRERNLIL
ncbi:MAG: DUF507 family protein [Nitrospirae bacterium]|nr:MAG: DUF507 family protein [Nitrospirota bacterium]